ncbi:type VI secretion system protein IglI family protein [Corallococcus terminator]
MADPAHNLPPFDGTFLEQPLEGEPPRQAPGDEPDPRVEAVTETVASGDYATAARGAETLLREGQRDTRLVGAYLFGAFQEQGLLAMPGLFRSLLLVLTTSRAAFGPEAKRDIFLESGLRWLLRSMNKHLAHNEKKQDATWKRWCEADNRAPIEEALKLSEPILTALPSLPKNGCEEPMRNLSHWLRRHLEALPPPAPPALALAPQPLPQAAPSRDNTSSEKPAPRAETAAPAAPTVAGVPISAPLALLLRKLEAFNTLVANGEMTKAGVIAADVLATVERFDPRVYLPSLFTRFYAGLSRNASGLEPFLHETDSLPMRALEQLYRVDLDAFLDQPSLTSGEED